MLYFDRFILKLVKLIQSINFFFFSFLDLITTINLILFKTTIKCKSIDFMIGLVKTLSNNPIIITKKDRS